MFPGLVALIICWLIRPSSGNRLLACLIVSTSPLCVLVFSWVTIEDMPDIRSATMFAAPEMPLAKARLVGSVAYDPIALKKLVNADVKLVASSATK